MMRGWLLLLSACLLLPAQDIPFREQEALKRALGEAGNSTPDLIRAIEAHMEKFPDSAKRPEFSKALFQGAVELNDHRRIVLHGEKMLEQNPQDPAVLEAVARSLVKLGGAENARRAAKHGAMLEQVWRLTQADPDDSPRQAIRKREERDRGVAEALLLQARAADLLTQQADAIRLARASFLQYPSAEAARFTGHRFAKAGNHQEAVAYLASAFVLVDPKVIDETRIRDRQALAASYRAWKGSETGLGDAILAAHDRIGERMEARRQAFLKADPNALLSDPMEFTLSGLGGAKLSMPSLLGNVIVMDFWATWCGPCRVQHPEYEEVKKRFRDRKDVAFLSINTDQERGLVQPFLEENQWSKTVYFEDGLSRLLRVSSIPTTIVIDKQGRIASRMQGFIPGHFADQLTGRIRELLKGE